MKVLITAGPTREKVDAVRFLSNASSGKMGYALADAARERGAEVTLISGPVALTAPAGVRLIRVESAAEMFDSVAAEFPDCDVLVMAAAVADYRPARVFPGKLKKTPGPLTIELERTVDILSEMGKRKRPNQILVGFAAETENLENYAREKLERKNLDFIAANLASEGFGTDTDTLLVFDRAGRKWRLGSAAKPELARSLLKIVLPEPDKNLL